MTESLNHIEFEKRWQTTWDDSQLCKTDESSDEDKCNVLDMLLYPSGPTKFALD